MINYAKCSIVRVLATTPPLAELVSYLILFFVLPFYDYYFVLDFILTKW